MDASEIYLRRNQGERSIDATKKWIFVFSQQQMVQLNCQEETTNSENPLLRQEQPVGVWRSQWRTWRRTGRVSTDRNKRWRWSPERLLGRSKVASSVVITVNVEFNSVCRMKKHSLWNTLMSPGLLTQIWMCCKKKRKDDYWNVHANRSLSGSWTGFTKLTLLSEKPPTWFLWSGEILTTNQATTDLKMRLAVWTQIGKAAQQRKKQEWTIELPKRRI